MGNTATIHRKIKAKRVKNAMAYDPKRVVVFGATGLLISAVLIMILQLSPLPIIPEIPVVPAQGLLIIKVKDAPTELQELWMKIDEVRVHRVTEEANGESPWIDVTVVQTDRFDLLTLTDFSIVLATQELPVGNYNEIRLGIYNNPDPEDEDNTYAIIDEEKVPLKVVANGKLMIKVHFALREEGVTTIEVDIQVHNTSIIRSKTLHPVVKATVEEDGIGRSKPVQTHFRWANDSGGSFEWLASEDETVTEIATEGDVLRLRLSVLNDEDGAIWSGVQLKLQYANDTEGDWTDVNATGSDGVWRYFDGNGTDKALVGNLFLSGSDVMEHFVESSPTETIVMVPVDEQGEWDVCIESNGADPDETYYFRFVFSDGTPLYDYSEYPTLTTEASD